MLFVYFSQLGGDQLKLRLQLQDMVAISAIYLWFDFARLHDDGMIITWLQLSISYSSVLCNE